ncbi:hypothetical protein [Sphingomonas sp. 3-13AW]|uniref:hypothetical protein n=1 Tax=Sphingomonas sp. 3-13AW TaxID=3050450 RepID=UPI003BB5F9DB
MNAGENQQTNRYRAFHERLASEDRHPALAAEEAIRNAMDAARNNDAGSVHLEVEYAKHALITRRCGMDQQDHDIIAMLRAPGISLCSGLSNVSELALSGQLRGVIPILAEAALRARALAQ